jgi:hypothetical protein
MGKIKEVSSAVKIDTSLLNKVEDFIGREENRLKYNNKKQFVNIAVYEFLEKMLKEGRPK